MKKEGCLATAYSKLHCVHSSLYRDRIVVVGTLWFVVRGSQEAGAPSQASALGKFESEQWPRRESGRYLKKKARLPSPTNGHHLIAHIHSTQHC